MFPYSGLILKLTPSTFMQQKSTFCLVFQSTAMLKSRKRLAQDVVCTSAMYEGLVHDVTDSQTQNGSAHSHVFATFTHVNLLINRIIKLIS